MIKVVIIGSGNVAQHLVLAFTKSDTVNIVQVFARQKNDMTHLLDSNKITNNYNELVDADVYIIAVSDNAIAGVSAQLPFKNKLVVHTSGGIAIDSLNNNNKKGVFYPLQTFTKNASINFKEVPLCIETKNELDFFLLETIAKSISNLVYTINSEQRKSLHVSAVFVCNFVNHLYKIGHDICEHNQLPFAILKPLIKETASKIMVLSPNEAQTGPAKRNDTETINAHLAFLSDENQKDIYKILTKSIIDNG
jgi:predicted short-subunit dehydrogenase-like oxidoreductase (DUF2520 family)